MLRQAVQVPEVGRSGTQAARAGLRNRAGSWPGGWGEAVSRRATAGRFGGAGGAPEAKKNPGTGQNSGTEIP